MKTQSILSMALLGLLSGCSANLVAVRYDSSPSGATLYIKDSPLIAKPKRCIEGPTPQICIYKLTEEQQKQTHITLPGAKVRWASGATAEVRDLVASEKIRDASYFSDKELLEYTFKRPADYPNLEIDLSVEKKFREQAELEAYIKFLEANSNLSKTIQNAR